MQKQVIQHLHRPQHQHHRKQLHPYPVALQTTAKRATIKRTTMANRIRIMMAMKQPRTVAKQMARKKRQLMQRRMTIGWLVCYFLKKFEAWLWYLKTNKKKSRSTGIIVWPNRITESAELMFVIFVWNVNPDQNGANRNCQSNVHTVWLIGGILSIFTSISHTLCTPRMLWTHFLVRNHFFFWFRRHTRKTRGENAATAASK